MTDRFYLTTVAKLQPPEHGYIRDRDGTPNQWSTDSMQTAPQFEEWVEMLLRRNPGVPFRFDVQWRGET